MSTSRKQNDLSILFLRNNPYPMWVFDHRTLEFLEINGAAILKYGYSRSEFLKMKITDIRPKDQVPKLLAGIRPFRLNGDRITDRQHLTKDGRLIDVEVTASQLYFKGRKAVLVEVQDITERRQEEESLRRLAIAEERNRIARDIHDTLAQAFTGIILQLEAAQDVLRTSPTKTVQHITQARNLARKSLTTVRQSVWKIHEPSNGGGLSSRTKQMTDQLRRLGVPIQYSMEGDPRPLSEEIENNLFGIIREALTNAIKYAKATKMDLTLSFRPDNVKIILKDNGKGFLPVLRRKGFGLISIQERADRIGAKLTISSKPGKGSKIIVSVST
jgi:PAS domain S-box-containing protein